MPESFEAKSVRETEIVYGVTGINNKKSSYKGKGKRKKKEDEDKDSQDAVVENEKEIEVYDGKEKKKNLGKKSRIDFKA